MRKQVLGKAQMKHLALAAQQEQVSLGICPTSFIVRDGNKFGMKMEKGSENRSELAFKNTLAKMMFSCLFPQSPWTEHSFTGKMLAG